MSNHIVIFSHGFGVRKDSRGMFTDIAAALKGGGIETILFDYNQFDESTNTLKVAPLTDQAEKLKQIIADARAENPRATIDLICHSQGCVVAGLAKPLGIRKFVLTGPPAVLSAQRMAEVFGSRPGARLDKNGVSRFPRRDGSTTVLPKEYWASIQDLDPVALYNNLAKNASVTTIHANQDEIIGSQDFSRLSGAVKKHYIDGGHDFTGAARSKLAELTCRELL